MNKLLSHRLRGFGYPEFTRSALFEACNSDVKYFEIDTRVSKDGVIFVYHDSKILFNGKNTDFRSLNAVDLKKYYFSNGDPLEELEKFLALFKKHSKPDQILCIDIKDYGFEKRHLEIIRNIVTDDKIIFISWIPQTLLDLFKLGSTSPLILSHVNLIKFSFWGLMFRLVTKKLKFRIMNYALIGHEKFNSNLYNLSHGYQHLYLPYGLPSEILHILSSSKGGICVPIFSLNDKLFEFKKSNNISLWVFTENNYSKYIKLRKNTNIDIIFSDYIVEN